MTKFTLVEPPAILAAMAPEDIAPWLEKDVFATLSDGSRVRLTLVATPTKGVYLATTAGPLKAGNTTALPRLNAIDIIKLEAAPTPEVKSGRAASHNPAIEALFEDIDSLIAAEEGKHPNGSLQQNALERLKAVVKEQRELAAKFSTVTADNAQALLQEGVAMNARIVEALSTYAALLGEAAINYDRDLLRRIQEFKLP